MRLKNCPICGDKMKFDTEPFEEWINIRGGTHDTVIRQYYIVVHATDHMDGLTEEQATCPFRMPLKATSHKYMAAEDWNRRVDEYTNNRSPNKCSN